MVALGESAAVIRTFVAVELQHDLLHAIARRQDQLKEGINAELRKAGSEARLQWVRPESIHLTLKFLGDVDERRIDPLCRALTEAVSGLEPFSVQAHGVGVFPDLRMPRVLWVGLSDSDHQSSRQSLTHLAQEVDRAFHGLGFPSESRPFSPHLTLARIKERPREMGHVLRESGLLLSSAPLGTIDVSAVALMKSVLQPSGALYTALCRAMFTAVN